MCALAAPLIAACLGYVPPSGSAVQVTQSCISQFSGKVIRRAIQCAREHRVSWVIR